MEKETKSNAMKQTKVDNWATFFMQRLQLLFAKGDACDITLKFTTGQELKVHSLVLRTCTTHFDTLAKSDNVISLPESLSYTAVFPIINFMYSGKLEFKHEHQANLLAVAKVFNIPILTKLLSAQKEATSGATTTTVRAKQVSTPTGKTTQQIVLHQSTPGTSPRPSGSVGLFQGKKLPFWKKRTFPIIGERKPIIDEEPGPTRFDWPEGESTDILLMASPSFNPLSYETDPIVKTPCKLERSSSPTRMPTRRVLESRVLGTNDSDDDDDDRFAPTYSSDDEPVQTPTKESRSLKRETPETRQEVATTSIKTLTPKTPRAPTPPRSSVGSTSTSSPTPLKPCLKTPTSELPSTPPTKKVRFSLGSESRENTGTTPVPATIQTNATSHAKIIAEVLKKYPDLVKNKNIKLKISSPKQKIENGVSSGDEKTSYVVLKQATKCSYPGPAGNSNKNNGPFYCDHCPGDQVKFEQYFEFKKHLQEIHGEKSEARVCEFCGHKSSKRNIHFYHMLTKHNVEPPQNMKFPKCSECSHVFLTDGLLVKHMNNHIRDAGKESPKEFQCDICKLTLRSQTSLNAHKATCKPGNVARHIICDLCKTSFRTNISLNAHLKVCQGKSEEGSTSGFSNDGEEPIEMIEVPLIEAVNMDGKGDHTLVQLPSSIILSDNQSMTLVQSSESESLNNLSSGITTSICLTTALPQDQHVILLHGDGPEYIVPEFLEGSFTGGQLAYTSNNQLIYLGNAPGNGNQQEILQLEEIKMNQETPSTSGLQDGASVKSESEPSSASLDQSQSSSNEEQISQSVIINVHDDLTKEEAAELSQSGIILVESGNKEFTDQDTGSNNERLSEETPVILGLDESEECSGKENDSLHVLLTSDTELKDTSNDQELTVVKEKSDSENDRHTLDEEQAEIDIALRDKEIEENLRAMHSDSPVDFQKEHTKESRPIPIDELREGLVMTEALASTSEDSSKEMVVESKQTNSEAEHMQVDEGREDMIVDEEKDGEEMDVEENVEAKESKDAMDVEESKTGDDKGNNLVKDWGFDDDDTTTTEEVIKDPLSKPLRPEMEDIPL